MLKTRTERSSAIRTLYLITGMLTIHDISCLIYPSLETAAIFLPPQEYGLTVDCVQRYKIPSETGLFVCLFIVLESTPAYPTLREWRNWQTRET